MSIFQVDRLTCKKEVVKMIITGHPLHKMVEMILAHGERCSKSSLNRYMNEKFVAGYIYEDGSVEVKEKNGARLRVTRYSSAPSGEPIEIKLLDNY